MHKLANNENYKFRMANDDLMRVRIQKRRNKMRKRARSLLAGYRNDADAEHALQAALDKEYEKNEEDFHLSESEESLRPQRSVMSASMNDEEEG